jgi:hypothetical protein
MATFKACVERVVQGLKASKDGELQWLLGDAVRNHYNPAESPRSKESKLSDVYLPHDKSVDFLYEAFEELQRSRLLLRWSYPYAMFQFEEEYRKAFGPNGMVLIMGDRSAQKNEFFPAQNALEKLVEGLSDLLSYKRLRGHQEDIVEAYLAAKSQRVVLESIIVGHNPSFGSGSLSMSRSRSVDERQGPSPADLGPPSGPVRMAFSTSVDEEGAVMRSAPKASSNAPPSTGSGNSGTTKVSSYSAAMEFDVNNRTSTGSTSTASAAKPAPTMKPPSAPAAPAPAVSPATPKAKAPIIQEPDSEDEAEDVQVCTDVTVSKNCLLVETDYCCC